MIVSEFIEWLKTQDQEAIVRCIVCKDVRGYYSQGGSHTEESFDLDKFTYVDFRGNTWVKPEEKWYNKRFLLIGREE